MVSIMAEGASTSTTDGPIWGIRAGVGTTRTPSLLRCGPGAFCVLVTVLIKLQGTHFNPPTNKSFDTSYKTWDENAYGNGPLPIGFQGYVPDSGVGFIEACEAANIPIVNDLNTGDGVGVKQGTGSLDARIRRSSSYDAFYKPIKDRPNLDVLYDASVQHLIFDDESRSPKVSGVGVVYQPDGLVYELTAKKEVIVSMGAFHSPQLLMISVCLDDTDKRTQ